MKKLTFKPFIMPLLIIFCTLFYYFGELVDWAAWDALRQNFFFGIHDVHRLLFLAPIVYAAYNARIKGAIIVTLVTFVIFLPRAFFISPYPDPFLRMFIFVVFAGVIGYLVAVIRNEQIKYQKLEAARTLQRDTMLNIINNMADGVLITDRDYRIRFINTGMEKEFGKGIDSTCYHLLQKTDKPCQDCQIASVINNNKTKHWECKLPDGRKFEVTAAPYIDDSGATCQISIFRKVSQDKPA